MVLSIDLEYQVPNIRYLVLIRRKYSPTSALNLVNYYFGRAAAAAFSPDYYLLRT